MRVAIQGLGVDFGSVQALSDVNVDLEPGLTGLLGVNGAGKTTLFRVLAGSLPATRGEVVLGDAEGDLTHAGFRRSLAKLTGYLPQDVPAVRGLTARQYVEYFAFLNGMPRGQAREAAAASLDTVGLAAEADKASRKLSGGMRRRMGLAAAIVHEPPLLLLDEPMAGLDPEQRRRMRQVIEVCSQKATVLLSTHLAEDVAELAGRVCVLDHGRVRFTGTLGELVPSTSAPSGSDVEKAFLALLVPAGASA